jgi:hypothetical protein
MPQTLVLTSIPLQKSKMNLHYLYAHFIMPHKFAIFPQHQAKFGYFLHSHIEFEQLEPVQ